MPVTVLYFLSLYCEQSPHRQLFIDSSAGCSCVWILLDEWSLPPTVERRDDAER